MRVVEPRYEIISCPDGEECLAKLERICRVAYKSEDKIDPGVACRECCGDGEALRRQGDGFFTPTDCSRCKGSGWAKEPSSHKLIRRILKTNRRGQLAKAVREFMVRREPPTILIGMAGEIVDLVLDQLRDDPPHESVIEHESITVLFTGNRGFTHELVRHRLAAFTQESTRYCNYAKGKFGSSITVTARPFSDMPGMLADWEHSLLGIERAYLELVEGGAKPQMARDVLPQVLKAEIVITANLREWRHIFRMRCSPKAHPDMRRLMIPLRDELRQRIPIVFDEV